MTNPETVEIRFSRQTLERESEIIHKAGDILTVSLATAQRWLKRNAAVVITAKESATKTLAEPPKTGKPGKRGKK